MQLGATVSLAEIPDEAVSEGVCMRLGLSRPRPAGRVVSLLRGDRGQVFVYLAGARGGAARDGFPLSHNYFTSTFSLICPENVSAH